jgi:hypothetical protein
MPWPRRRSRSVRHSAQRKFASMRPRQGPWPTSSCNPPSNSRAWGLEPAAARASCGRVHRRKPRMQPQPGAQDREREDERCFSWNPVTPSDARDGSLVPLGRAQAPIPRHFTVSRSRAQAPCDLHARFPKWVVRKPPITGGRSARLSRAPRETRSSQNGTRSFRRSTNAGHTAHSRALTSPEPLTFHRIAHRD